MEGEGQETIGAEGLPAAIFANSEGSRAAAIVEDKSLAVVGEIVFNGI